MVIFKTHEKNTLNSGNKMRGRRVLLGEMVVGKSYIDPRGHRCTYTGYMLCSSRDDNNYYHTLIARVHETMTITYLLLEGDEEQEDLIFYNMPFKFGE
jgi:hypothetical protein